jgi:hypothetical protein
LNMVDSEVCREKISAHDAARRTRIASKPRARSNYCAIRLRNKRTRQRTRSTRQTTQGQAMNAFGEVATMDDGVGGSFTRQ